MFVFLLRRLIAVPFLLLAISLLTYALIRSSPGDFYSKLEQEPKYGFDYAMQLRARVGRAEPVAPERRASALGTFVIADRTYSFDASGALLRDGIPADARSEQNWVKRFRPASDPDRQWSVTEKGNVFRDVGAVTGYFHWLRRAAVMDFGESWTQKAPIGDVIRERLANTLILELVALAIAWGLAIPLGVWSGVRPNSTLDHICGAIAYMSLSLPGVFLALLCLLLAVGTGWFPVGNMRSDDYDTLSAAGKVLDVGWHVILPGAVVGLTQVAIYMRQMRGQMVEAMSSDYVRTARAKGLSTRAVQFRHALRNAINPLVTMFGFSLAALLSGSYLVETVFNWPGLAQVTTDAVFSKDEPLVMASVLFSALLLVAGNLVADVLLAIVDPRIRLE